MANQPRIPDGPYDPQPRPSEPEVAPVPPGHAPQEVPVRDPVGVPSIDPDRAPSVDPGPAAPQSPGIPSGPQPTA